METDAIVDLLKNAATSQGGEEGDTEGDAEGSTGPPDFDSSALWDGLISTSKNDPRTATHVIAPILFALIESENERFRATDIAAIPTELALFSNPDASLADRLASGTALILYSPALVLTDFVALLSGTVTYIADYIAANDSYPKDFLDVFSEPVLEALPDSHIKAVADFFTGRTAPIVPSLVLLATFTDLFSGTDHSPDLLALVLEALQNSDASVQSAGAFALSEFADAVDLLPTDKRPSSTVLYDALLPLLTGADASAARYAARAYRALISGHILNDQEQMVAYLATFDRHGGSNKRYWAKVVQSYISPSDDEDEDESQEEEDSIDLARMQVIYDWVDAHVETEDAFSRGIALDVLQGLTTRSKASGEDLIPRGIATATAIVEARELSAFPFVADFLVIVAKEFEDQAPVISPLLAPLIAVLRDSEVGSLKIRLYMATAIAAVIEEGVGKDDLPALVAFTLEMIPTLDKKHLWVVGSILLTLRKILPDDAANAVFPIIAARAVEETSDERLAGWMSVLRKLVKYHSITPESVASVVDPILGGTLSAFFGRKPGKCFEIPSPVYSFLGQVIKKSPATAKPIVETIIAWFEDAVFQAVPLLEPITAALTVGLFDLPLAQRFAPLAKRILSGCDENDSDDITAITEVLAGLFAHFPRALDPLDEILAVYAPLVHSVAVSVNNEEEEADGSDLIETTPAVFQFVLDIYAGTGTVEVNEGLLVDLVSLLPFPPGVPQQPGIFEGLVELFEDSAKFKCLAKPFALVLVGLLMQKQSELEGYEFSTELLASMKKTFKKIVKADKKLETSLLQQFRGSKAKQNHFRALIR